MKKNIAAILCSEPSCGGEHQYALTLMECLKDNKNINIMAICSNGYWRKWCKDNHIRILNGGWYSFTNKEQKFHMKYPLFSKIYCMHMSELGKVFRREKIDVILMTTQGLFVPNVGAKVVAPVHDLMHRYERKFPEVSNEYDARELVYSSKAKYAWCVFTDSMMGRQQFIESYLHYMRKKRKLPHIISLPFVVSKHVIQRKDAFIEVPSKYVFYPAQFWKHKNHLNLVKAINLLVRKLPDIHLVLVGSEKNAMREVKHYISDNGLDSNVTIKGFVSNENITYLYRHAVGMIMPSFFGPTNIPPLEAMALGCPVAVSNKYAMPEQVGDAGLLFNPDSPEEIAACIKMLWCDDNLRQKMVRKGYDRIKKWTINDFKKRLRKVIDNI